MIEFFSLLSEASEPITKLLGKFFVVEIFRRISWFRIKSGSVSLSRFDLWLVVVDPSERRTAPGAICTPDRPPRMFGSLASEVGQDVLSRTGSGGAAVEAAEVGVGRRRRVYPHGPTRFFLGSKELLYSKN